MSPDPHKPSSARGQTGQIGVGTVIQDRYEIESIVGGGGFATIFGARQAHLGRVVAVKVLNVALALEKDETFEARFLREARLLSQLQHPNVVSVFDFGFAGQLRQPFMVMELLEGHDLEVELKESGPLAPARAIALFRGALSALAAVHAHEVVHKDLKPANLFLTTTRDGRELIKVLDFGIARDTRAEATRYTNTGQFTGTPQYAAPEYISAQDATPALDVYQMGLILSEAISGKVAADAPMPMSCLMKHAQGQLDIPAELTRSPLGKVLSRALSLKPGDRYEDAGEMLAALETVDPADVPSWAVDVDEATQVAMPAFESGDHVAEPTSLDVPAAHDATREVDSMADDLDAYEATALVDAMPDDAMPEQEQGIGPTHQMSPVSGEHAAHFEPTQQVSAMTDERMAARSGQYQRQATMPESRQSGPISQPISAPNPQTGSQSIPQTMAVRASGRMPPAQRDAGASGIPTIVLIAGASALAIVILVIFILVVL